MGGRPVLLALAIGSNGYWIQPIDESPIADARRAFELRKHDGASYHVVECSGGPQCSCPDFVFRRDGLDPSGCKHIKALRVFRMIDPPPAPATKGRV